MRSLRARRSIASEVVGLAGLQVATRDAAAAFVLCAVFIPIAEREAPVGIACRLGVAAREVRADSAVYAFRRLTPLLTGAVQRNGVSVTAEERRKKQALDSENEDFGPHDNLRLNRLHLSADLKVGLRWGDGQPARHRRPTLTAVA
jgi:hypothetical protein